MQQGEVDPLPMNLESQPVGENPERTGGRLHVTFDSYPMPIIADQPCYLDYRRKQEQNKEEDHATTARPSMSRMSVTTAKKALSPGRKVRPRDQDFTIFAVTLLSYKEEAAQTVFFISISTLNTITTHER